MLSLFLFYPLKVIARNEATTLANCVKESFHLCQFRPKGEIAQEIPKSIIPIFADSQVISPFARNDKLHGNTLLPANRNHATIIKMFFRIIHFRNADHSCSNFLFVLNRICNQILDRFSFSKSSQQIGF